MICFGVGTFPCIYTSMTDVCQAHKCLIHLSFVCLYRAESLYMYTHPCIATLQAYSKNQINKYLALFRAKCLCMYTYTCIMNATSIRKKSNKQVYFFVQGSMLCMYTHIYMHCIHLESTIHNLTRIPDMPHTLF